MEQAATNERNRKAEAEAIKKRTINVADSTSEAKRQKTEHASVDLASVLANFDLATLPNTLITDIIVSNLQLLTNESLAAAVMVSMIKSCVVCVVNLLMRWIRHTDVLMVWYLPHPPQQNPGLHRLPHLHLHPRPRPHPPPLLQKGRIPKPISLPLRQNLSTLCKWI